MPLNISCPPGFFVTVTTSPVKADGVTPARLDGAISATVTNAGNGSATSGPGASEVQLDAASGAVIGDVIEFLVSGDADLGAGVRSLEDTVTMTVIAEPEEEATALGLTASTPTRR